jgi:osmotically-inducible protein OsmY
MSVALGGSLMAPALASRADEEASTARGDVERTERTAKRAADRTERAGDDVERATRRAGERTKTAVERAGTKAAKETSDAWITTKVKTQILAEDALDGSDIDVDTSRNGEVTLKGTVPTDSARTAAVDIARRTDGVHKVNDALVVDKATGRTEGGRR